MSVHFIYRTPYYEPNNKYYKRFEDNNTVLEWFQNLWRFHSPDADEFYDKVKKYLGTYVYGFWGPFHNLIEEENVYTAISVALPPTDYDGIRDALLNGYCNEVKLKGNSGVQVHTDDDELDLAYYIFDDNYANKNLDKVAYLIHNTWELPEDTAVQSNFKPKFKISKSIQSNNHQGNTFLVCFLNWAGGNLSEEELDLSIMQIKGIRLPDLYQFLRISTPDENWNFELAFLRAQVGISESMKEAIKSLVSFSDFHGTYQNANFNFEKIWEITAEEAGIYLKKCYQEQYLAFLEKHNLQGEILNKSKMQFSEHIIQVSLHVETWSSQPMSDSEENAPLFHHWILFDDLWATQHPNLANSIIRFASRWDVL